MPSLGQRVGLAARAAVGLFNDGSLTQAWGLLSGIWPGGLGAPPQRGIQNYLDAYNKMPWLRAVAARIASAVAQTEWELLVTKKKAEPRAYRHEGLQRAKSVTYRRQLRKALEANNELTALTTHPLLDVLHDANNYQTGDAMWKTSQLHLDLAGECFWLKERDGLGTVVGLWPVPPHWVINTPTPTNRFYRVQFRGWRGMIPDTEFVWFADPDPLNPYSRGSGTAQSLGDELETDEYAAKHTKAYFFNRARPDLIIYPKAGSSLRPEQVARLEEDWLNRNRGFWRAFKPYFLTREVGVEQIEQNFRSMQFTQLREYERNCIIQTFGLPPELLGVIENSNRATIEASDYLMSRYVVLPRLEFIRAVMQERLLPEFDERLVIDFVSPVQDDKGRELAAAQAAPWSLSVDEWRVLTGHPPLDKTEGADKGDDGSLHLIPNILTPKRIEESEPPPPPLPPGAVPPPGTSAGPGLPPGDGPPADGPPKPGDDQPKPEDVKPGKVAYRLATEASLRDLAVGDALVGEPALLATTGVLDVMGAGLDLVRVRLLLSDEVWWRTLRDGDALTLPAGARYTLTRRHAGWVDMRVELDGGEA